MTMTKILINNDTQAKAYGITHNITYRAVGAFNASYSDRENGRIDELVKLLEGANEAVKMHDDDITRRPRHKIALACARNRRRRQGGCNVHARGQ